jgi:hypothetical protein
MEVGELSRAIGRTWGELWRRVKKCEERKDVGRALSASEQKRLLDALKDCHAPHLKTLVPLLLLTGMRAGEAMSLTWGQIDLMERTLRVGRAKSANGTGRMIPINDDLSSTLAAHYKRFSEDFAEPRRGHYVFAWGSPVPSDPTRPVSYIKHGWETLRDLAKVSCRLHDLRHTFATRLAENGVPESTMLALMGHMSRAMLELPHSDGFEAGCGIGRCPSSESRRESGAGSKFGGSPCESPCSCPCGSVLYWRAGASCPQMASPIRCGHLWPFREALVQEFLVATANAHGANTLPHC